MAMYGFLKSFVWRCMDDSCPPCIHIQNGTGLDAVAADVVRKSRHGSIVQRSFKRVSDELVEAVLFP